MTSGITILVLDGSAMAARWEEIECVIRIAFDGAQYNDAGYTIDNPIKFTRAGVDGKLRSGLKYLLAVNGIGEIIGGSFCIPTERDEGEVVCDAGWFFIIPQADGRTRLRAITALVEHAHEMIREAGFQRIESNMGTMAGGKTLSRRFGWVHSPTQEKQNRWIKEL